MNSYELAILRILVKRQTPIKIPDLISGFPDNSEYNVLDAISRLHSLGYVLLDSRTHFQRYLLLAKEKRREATEIISSNIGDGIQTRDIYSKQIVDSIKNNNGISKTLLFAMMGITAFSILLSGLVIMSISSPSWLIDDLHLSHSVSTGQTSPLLISTFPSGDQYAGSSATTELAYPIVLVGVGSLDEPTTKTMIHRVLSANPNSGVFSTTFLAIDTNTHTKSSDFTDSYVV